MMKRISTSASDIVHRHGGDPAAMFPRLGVKPRPIVDFSVSVNPLGPPRAVLMRWLDWRQDIGRYPTATGEGIAGFYREQWDLDSNCVLPGNGSAALIYLVLRVLGLRKLTIVSPSFHDYARAAHAAGTRTRFLPLSAHNGFSPLAQTHLVKAIESSDGLTLGRPNNPTGTLHPRDMLLDLARRYPDKWLLIDEAFIQFVEEHRTQTLLTERPMPANVLVFHSLTKFYALPGLRLGTVVGHPETISNLRRHQEPWPVSRIAERAAEALSHAWAYEARTVRWLAEERGRLLPRLQKMRSLRFVPPTANFILAQWRATNDLDDLLRRLLTIGYHVRDCRNFPGLERNYFRFAIRRPAENDGLLQAIADADESGHV